MQRHATSRQKKARTEPLASLRAVVLLNTATSSSGDVRERPTKSRRQAVIDETRKSASQALSEIDGILARFDGRRLSAAPTALGTVIVESNTEGLAALAESAYVKGVIQDQPVSKVS